MKVDLCYHHTDHDGIASAVCVGAHKNLGVSYNTQLNSSAIMNECAGRTVAMVDFSFPRDTMNFIIKCCKKFIWIDHHEEAIDPTTPSGDMRDLYNDPKVEGLIDLEKAGAYAAKTLIERVQELARTAGTSASEVDIWQEDRAPQIADGSSIFLGRTIFAQIIGQPDLVLAEHRRRAN